ncbi:hypothetical protein BGW80DRAFT_1563939 [Lactifluus volemus]|nr:hypothetical protein BGW80DRAFT_1563939 [Lactifluus volemus]
MHNRRRVVLIKEIGPDFFPTSDNRIHPRQRAPGHLRLLSNVFARLVRWWHALVHVCRRWRYVVFESPLRLHLRILCNASTPVKKKLYIWPCSFPIVIQESRYLLHPRSEANIIPALEHHDRVSEIDLFSTSGLMERFYKVMKKPYPVLTRLCLDIRNSALVLRGTFLGISAPRLKELSLYGIPFPALPKLLSSCHDLVKIQLKEIPITGYISPEAMATALSALTKLEVVHIGFESLDCPSRPVPPNRSPTRVVLPALTHFEFHGDSEYFEDLVARVDTPALIYIETWFLNHAEFDMPHFVQFIGRTQILGSFKEAELYFLNERVNIRFGHRDPPGRNEFRIALSIDDSSSRTLTPLTIWRLYMQIPPKLGEVIASALRELTGERVMDALPMLRHLYLPPPSLSTQQAIEPFISSRQRSNHPVTVHLTDLD